MRAFAELSDDGKRIQVNFPYSTEAKDAVKSIGGARFVPVEKGGPHWLLPLDLASAKILRQHFGEGLELGVAIKRWGHQEVEKSRKLGALAAVDDVPIADLKIATKLPELAEWLRPYQRADIAFMGTTSVLNLNEPRLGKTAEVIGAVYEGNLELGPQLVIAPQKSLETVWRMEIERWTKDAEIPGVVFTYSADNKDSVDEFYDVLDEMESCVWWVTTADMLRRDRLPEVEWNTRTVDEYHKTGLLRASGVNDEKKNSKFTMAMRSVQSERDYRLSGTPIGGKAIKLWSGLNSIAPEVFTSKWRWADNWLEVVEDDNGHKLPGGLREDRKPEFDSYHAPYIIRRLREEVLPQLPPKLQIPVWCEMLPAQRKQYEQFALDLEVKIDEHRVHANNVLVEYTRLKQFSNALCTVEVVGTDDIGEPKLKVKPTEQSGKLPYLLERLAEDGIDPDDPVGTTQAIVASQFREVVEMVSNYLTSKGIANICLSGKSKKAESELAQRAFKAENDNEGLRVCCMVTTMGVGLTLDNVTSVHVMDETWNPDDQEQLTDRAVNTTRNHQVSVLTYRSLLSIEEEIYKENAFKTWTNKDVLDARRRGFRATRKAKC
jgi:SNF2 family DNA or RNA helicase